MKCSTGCGKEAELIYKDGEKIVRPLCKPCLLPQPAVPEWLDRLYNDVRGDESR